MKWSAGMCLLIAVLVAAVCPAAGAEKDKAGESIKLSRPDLDKGNQVMKAIKSRKSERNYSDKNLSPEQLSELVWAANGVSRKSGKRTFPSAGNIQSVEMYVLTAEGVYLYDYGKHELKLVVAGDHRKYAGWQKFVPGAPVNLVYVADMGKFKRVWKKDTPEKKRLLFSAIEAGSQVQNVGLYCASAGLGSVVRDWIDREKFGKLVGLRPDQEVIIAQTVGVPKKRD